MDSAPRLFADDTAILMRAGSLNELQFKLNHELVSVLKWTHINNLTIIQLNLTPL